MGEVEAEDIRTGRDQLVETRVTRGCRAQCGDNLGQAMHNA
jgi:hypothetical protein